MTSRRLWFLVPRLAALLGTSYLLIATSRVPAEHCGASGCAGSQICAHASESITFHVTGTCGPEGDIQVSSAMDECAITVMGASAVDLPSAGRFDENDDTVVSLGQDAWTLSGFPPEGPLPDAGVSTVQPDAGIFTVVRDAQAGPDVGGFTVTPGSGSPGGSAGTHATPTLRTCAYAVKDGKSATLTCTGGGIAGCQAVLTRY